MSSMHGAHGLRTIQSATTALTESLTRLSTARRLNRAADDPAGLIASENLSAQLAAIDAESRGLQRQSMVIDTADGAMSQMSDMLVRAEGLAVQAAGGSFMSPEEKSALQMEMDSVVNTIDRMAGNSTFNGMPMFDGSMTFESGAASVTIGAMTSSTLGLSDLRRGGALALDGGDAGGALAAIRQARTDIGTARAETGAYAKNTIQARMSDLAVSAENLSSARSMIRDTDMAHEIMQLNRAEMLLAAGIASTKASMDSGGMIVDVFG